MVNVECVSDFNEQPDLHLSFYYNGVMQNVDIKLPVSSTRGFGIWANRSWDNFKLHFSRFLWTSSSNQQIWMGRHFSPDGKIWACPLRSERWQKSRKLWKHALSSWQCHVRLKQIVQNCVQESQKIFKAEYPMENVEATKTKLIGYGFQLLEGEP